MELYGSPTTKEVKKKNSSRPVGRAEMGSQVERTHSKALADRQERARRRLVDLERQWFADWVQINREEQLGSETDQGTQSFIEK